MCCVHRVEKIEAGNETPVEEPVSEEQKEDGGDQEMEAGDVVSAVEETKLDQEDADASELTQVPYFSISFHVSLLCHM